MEKSLKALERLYDRHYYFHAVFSCFRGTALLKQGNQAPCQRLRGPITAESASPAGKSAGFAQVLCSSGATAAAGSAARARSRHNHDNGHNGQLQRWRLGERQIDIAGCEQEADKQRSKATLTT